MRQLSLDDLPEHSPWPARLLGLDDWTEESGFGGTGVNVYDEVYGNLLGAVRENPEMDFRDLQRSANHYAEESPVAISRAEELYLVDVDDKQELQDEALVASLAGTLSGGETVVSLGCGWGYELGVLAEAYPDCEFVGGEPAANGVELGRELFGDHDRIQIEEFDFRDDEWDLLEDVLTERDSDEEAGGHEGENGSVDGNGGERDDVVLFTQGSLTAIPSVEDIVTGPLSAYADRVREGVHLEHVCELHPDESLLGQLRRSYVAKRNYNDDLFSSLRATGEIDITSTTYDVVGGNPLHPLSEIRWESV